MTLECVTVTVHGAVGAVTTGRMNSEQKDLAAVAWQLRAETTGSRKHLAATPVTKRRYVATATKEDFENE